VQAVVYVTPATADRFTVVRSGATNPYRCHGRSPPTTEIRHPIKLVPFSATCGLTHRSKPRTRIPICRPNSSHRRRTAWPVLENR